MSKQNKSLRVKLIANPGALRVITTEKSSSAEGPQKDTTELLPVPFSLTEKKDHRVSSVISLE